MAKKPIKPLIRALAEHIADDVLASHDAGYPKRKRLPRRVYKEQLAEEDPHIKRGSKNVTKGKGTPISRGKDRRG